MIMFPSSPKIQAKWQHTTHGLKTCVVLVSAEETDGSTRHLGNLRKEGPKIMAFLEACQGKRGSWGIFLIAIRTQSTSEGTKQCGLLDLNSGLLPTRDHTGEPSQQCRQNEAEMRLQKKKIQVKMGQESGIRTFQEVTIFSNNTCK